MTKPTLKSTILTSLLSLLFVPHSFAQQPAQPRTAEGAVTPAEKDPKRHQQFLNRIKDGPVGLLFLGDSITDSWPKVGEASWLKFAKYNPADFGVSGDRTEHLLWRITHGELDGIDPKLVIIMIGTNNIGQATNDQPEWAAAGVKKIVETVREKLPNAKILLLAVFPRDDADSPHRAAIHIINEMIKPLADGQTIRYLDIGHVFLNAESQITPDIMPDKLHPTAKGYELWYDAMMPTVEEMLK